MSLAGLFAFLPQLLLGPFAGVWIDRWKRKHVIIAADLFLGLVAAVFAFSFSVGAPAFWAVYVVLAVRALGNVFHAPALQAVVPMLVPQEELVRANGWGQFLQSGAFMLGPVVGALLYAAFPLPVILLSDLVGALIASAAVLAVKIPEIQHPAGRTPDFVGEIKEGARVILRDRNLTIVTAATTLSMVFFMPLAVFYPLMTSDYFRASAWHAGLVEFLYALGMMLGAMALTRQGTIKDKLGLVHWGLFALAATSLLCGILPDTMTGFWIFAFLCLLMGASGNLYNIPYVAYMQETIPLEAQGRAFSLFGSLFSVTMPIGLLVAGPVAQAFGVTLWFLVAGVAMIGITLLSRRAVAKAAPRPTQA